MLLFFFLFLLGPPCATPVGSSLLVFFPGPVVHPHVLLQVGPLQRLERAVLTVVHVALKPGRDGEGGGGRRGVGGSGKTQGCQMRTAQPERKVCVCVLTALLGPKKKVFFFPK